MLSPRYTIGDIVRYRINDSSYEDIAVIIDGPVMIGCWYEYVMSNGSNIKDYEIEYLVGRSSECLD